VKVAKGKIDINAFALKELQNRGYNINSGFTSGLQPRVENPSGRNKRSSQLLTANC